MRVLVAVPAYRVARVRDVTPSGCVVSTVARLAQIDAAMHANPADVVVLDPLLDPCTDETMLLNTVRNHPCARWLVYTQLRPETARLLLALGSAGVRCAVFAGVDDSPTRVGALLRELAQDSITHQAQARIMAMLAPLPCRLRAAVEQCIRDHDAPLDVSDLAARACMTRRTLERQFLRAGLPTPKTILRAARVLTAYRLLYDGTRTCNGVAKTLGYGKVSTMRAHLKRTFGVHPRSLQSAPEPEIAISALLDPPESRVRHGEAAEHPAARAALR
ncbi:MAG TPA: helix-turn-helix domain-containing protein [Gemmatimonadaceae bacterium]|nr:helix-turn-helix domain-containing protein [Gemmatimonadaceae bacterium]